MDLARNKEVDKGVIISAFQFYSKNWPREIAADRNTTLCSSKKILLEAYMPFILI